MQARCSSFLLSGTTQLGASVVMKGVVTEILNTVYCMQKYEAMYGMYICTYGNGEEGN